MGKFDFEPRTLYDITCSTCGKPAKVPFKPDGVRPVYCRDCLPRKRRNNDVDRENKDNKKDSCGNGK